MEKVITATVVAAAAAIALGTIGAGAANADNSQDIQFMQLLDAHNIQTNELGVLWAHQICANIDAGSTPGSQVGEVYRLTARNFTYDMSLWFMAASIVEYCPWNAPAVWAGVPATPTGAPVAQVPVREQIA